MKYLLIIPIIYLVTFYKRSTREKNNREIKKIIKQRKELSYTENWQELYDAAKRS